ANLPADHRLEVAHHGRIRVRTRRGADDVIGVLDIGHPVSERLVHGVLERAGARGHRVDLGAQPLHADHVGLLALDIGCAHEDLARYSVARADRRHRYAVLAGARLGDDAGLAHTLRQKDLAQAVVDLMAAGVVELVALEVDLRAARPAGG